MRDQQEDWHKAKFKYHKWIILMLKGKFLHFPIRPFRQSAPDRPWRDDTVTFVWESWQIDVEIGLEIRWDQSVAG